MGWVILALLGVTTAALFVVLRVPRLLWPLVGATLMLGAAGYAWQGAPGLPGHPVSAEAVKLPVEPVYKEMRDTLFGRFNGESLYFGISDRMLGDGDTKAAAAVMTGGVRYAPQNAALWSELGNVLALHDHNTVSPASLFAFQQAMRLAPTHPGPPFFLGWAYIRSGQLAEAQPYWVRALALTPKDASYRSAIADRLAALNGFLAAGAPPPR
ncbi:tetratricopeptide repeat protein [Sphingomonas sp.]|jgi:predicted Zn-dependent protease|uniref:tetratricopeptide repeat protein n=1 Tax=Sphingomonas sp. TaxID=28214 RepID=UPI002E339EA8|nr:tetratricopeptide repeat protein [Sphingomonas sp.]HEX4693955.1 tetratricopeptide repeat protein [Sphingomonas sp.]